MRTVTLGEISRPKQWRTISKADMVLDGYPVYGANGVIGYAPEFTHDQPTIVLGCRGTIGAVHITAPRAFVTGNAMALDDLDTTRVDQRYLARFLEWRGLSDVTSGSSQPQLTRQNLVTVEVPLPSLAEQQRVAKILDGATAIRARRRQLVAHLNSLESAIFRDMFGLSQQWSSAPIGDLGRVITGRTPPTGADGMFDGPIPFVTPGDLGSGAPAVRTVTEQGANASRLVRAGSTLVCCIGATIGKVGLAGETSAFNQQINAVEWGEAIDDAYGLAAMRNLKPVIVARGASTTLPLLPKGQFVKLKVPVPPLELQRAFASRIARLHSHRDFMADALAADGELFLSLQSGVFRTET